ncbi:procollagen galactosyltransferase 1-like isoform X2 [Acanthaster planci]|uniref:Procollagen galactosyltransferase 1-like isoform X2 n=1 Tax=Acanthaster planci TaxID=133434 RepID=A0A8B7YNS5_ACAPL|nr:procollagen galactosyltransferase 1-like isoform X2 [Acanthaster planci]
MCTACDFQGFDFYGIRTDHNIDNTATLLQEWVNKSGSLYHRVDIDVQNEPQAFDWENGPSDWPDERYLHVITLRQRALEEARFQWADYLLAVDVDNFLENPRVLLDLMTQEKTVIAPMLVSTKMYSNFWGGTNQKGYYRRTEQYVHILKRNFTGVFEVPMVHSTYLINLRHKISVQLSYNPLPGFTGDIDDMMTFAFSAKKAGIPFHVTNRNYYGSLLIPLSAKKPLEYEKEQMLHLRLEAMVDNAGLPLSKHVSVPARQQSKLGFDEIYMINLKRRPERRLRMVAALKDLGIAFKIVDAVDGKALTDQDLEDLGVDMLPGYRDPYYERVLTRGEIGCFLSHYFIWQDVVRNNYKKILIFEDDVRFKESFRPKMEELLQEIAQKNLDWELLYIGRKIMERDYENYVDGFMHVVKPSYTYWTLSYMLTFDGAQKLLSQEPLGKMIPVDEYIPIMFDVHPENDWAHAFHPRDLKAYSVNPLLVEPTHYTGEEKYISDTETKDIWEYVLQREGTSDKAGFSKQQKDASDDPKSSKGRLDLMEQHEDDKHTGNKVWNDGQRMHGHGTMPSADDSLNGTHAVELTANKKLDSQDSSAESSNPDAERDRAASEDINTHTEL